MLERNDKLIKEDMNSGENSHDNLKGGEQNNDTDASIYEPSEEDFIQADKDFEEIGAQYYADSKASEPPYNDNEKSGYEKKYVTKKFLIISLIVSMVLTSIVTVLSYNFFATIAMPGATKKISATNYTLAKSTGSQLSAEEIIAKNENAVVEIRTESVNTDNWLHNYVREGAGSGVIIDSNGYIVTNNHVISGANRITVKLKNGQEFDARLIGTDPQDDIAVIKINASGITAVQYGDSSKLSVGQMTIAIGNPLGKLGGTATMGIISSLDRELTIDGKSMTLLQTDASINPGNSGGGLFDGSGNMVGLVVAKSSGSDVEGLGFAIPINKAAPIIKDLIENGKVTGRPVIGVQILDISKDTAEANGLDRAGVYVKKILSSSAEKAGIKAGDIIYAIEDEEIETAAQLVSKVQNYKVGQKINLTLIRNGSKKTVSVELVEGDQ